ncbi:MAG: ATP-binding protein [Pseudonocardiaceae bacterium]
MVDVCPYPGLAAFGPDQAQWFFGRERVTAELVSRLTERLEGTGPLVVTGPSGAGKSSLLRAGLLSALGEGRLPGSRS